MAIENGTKISVSASQVRAARALLGISQDELAAKSGIPKRTIVRFELEEGVPRQSTADAISDALEDAGIRFIAENSTEGEGVRFRRSNLDKYPGTPEEEARNKAWADAYMRAAKKRKLKLLPKDKVKAGV